MKCSLLIFLIIIFSFNVLHADLNTFDCKMRQLAMDFARKIQPYRTKDNFQQLADALNGAPEAKKCNVSIPADHEAYFGARTTNFGIPLVGTTVYVDAVKGNDSNPGSLDKPFHTLAKAVQATRTAGSGSTIILREGIFYLSSPILLTPNDNGLTIQNYPQEQVWISGAVPIKPTWKPTHVSTSPKVILFPNQNGVYHKAVSMGDTHYTKYLGQFNDVDSCQAACLAYSKDGKTCHSFTFHKPEYSNTWAKQCFAVIDDTWEPVEEPNTVSGKVVLPNVYVADLSTYGLSSVPGLRMNGGRAIRARYPNANPEFGFGSDLHAKSWLKPTLPTNPDIEINPATPQRLSSASFQRYQLGIGGPCKNFDPPAGYWCGNQTEGGGAFTYRVPSGMVADKSILPNSPYKDPTGAVVQAWRPGHWASWMFEVGSYEASSGTFHFSRGGFQGARGENSGDNFYIENVFEELDSPDEFFFDEKTKMLYLWYNGTGSPPPNIVFEVPQTKTLVNIQGTQTTPVVSVTIRGIGFKDTAYTYMDPHGMPSGGDWGLQRSGAIFISGTQKVNIDMCLFSRLDGNGIMISGYNRQTIIQRSEFVWIGDTAIASWGNAKGTTIPGMGWDGTDGDQPRFTQILENFIHEVGIWEKQSSFYFQAKSCQNNISRNIFFNGPRAGINFNDGFGGGSNLTENIVLNTCRESGDHGPFNSWDRQVYVTDVLNGSPSVNKDWDHIHHNFLIANYESQEAIDNDDGSCYYDTHDNFFAYSGNGMKSDYGGHDNHHYNNIYAFVGTGFSLSGQLTGHEDYFYKNKVILSGDGSYGQGTCSGGGKTVVHDNDVYSPTGNVKECGMTLAEWQAKGNDPGSTANKYPDDDVILGWLKVLFGL